MFLLLCLNMRQIIFLMKNNLVLLITGCFVWLMTSCLGNDDNNTEYVLPKNCQIGTFTLSHDSIKDLDKVKFTIDQLNGEIFNMDSLPYGTLLKKAICKITYVSESAVGGLKVMQEASNDTIDWNGTDSLDFSKPVKFLVTAYDGVTTKLYTSRVNTHQLNPDTLEWSLFATQITGQTMREQKVIPVTYNERDCYFLYAQPAGLNLPYRLFYSEVSDMKSWKELTLEGLDVANEIIFSQLTEYEGMFYLPSANGTLYGSSSGISWTPVAEAPYVSYILGDVKEGGRQTSALAAIVKDNDVLKFAARDNKGIWTTGEDVPANFPLIGFGKENYTSYYNSYLMVVGGKTKDNQLTNYSWGTIDGTHWALLTDEDSNYFGKREGVMVTTYDDKIYLFGGIDAAGKAYKDIYETIDKGLTWSLVDSMIIFPPTYRERGYASIVVDKEKYINIFGGKMTSNGNVMQEIWRGRINRLGFKE